MRRLQDPTFSTIKVVGLIKRSSYFGLNTSLNFQIHHLRNLSYCCLMGMPHILKNIELINMAREHNVIVVCFPPHCTHRLQPLDVSFVAPLSTYYEQEVKKTAYCSPREGGNNLPSCPPVQKRLRQTWVHL